MPKCYFLKADGEYLGGSMHDDMLYSASTHVQLELVDYLDPRLTRLDESETTTRAKTAPEIAAYDDTQVSSEIVGKIDQDKLVKALLKVNYNQENRIRVLEGKIELTLIQYRQALIDLYKSL